MRKYLWNTNKKDDTSYNDNLQSSLIKTFKNRDIHKLLSPDF